jgi:hypothetical protein
LLLQFRFSYVLLLSMKHQRLGEGDYLQILEIIETYDKVYPEGENSIGAAVTTARREQKELKFLKEVDSKTGVVHGNEAGRRNTVSMPTGLYILLKRKYPTLFTQYIEWFKAKFPAFVINK